MARQSDAGEMMTSESMAVSEREEALAAIDDSCRRVTEWMERTGYAGIEPHDALTSPLMRRTPLGRSRFIRLAALQALRRLPVNPRPLLGVRPRANAVSLGWALRALALRSQREARHSAETIVQELAGQSAQGYHGPCWGYYFDWQTRATFKPADDPIIVSTAFIGLGLMDVHARFGMPGAFAMARGACDFILQDLNRTPGLRGFCFSYGPGDHEQVFNASMLGAELLARMGAATGEETLTRAARDAVAFTLDHQQPDGSWAYGLDAHWGFIDNFHTGYVLCSLREYSASLGDASVADALERGWRFYRDHFFEAGRIPKYYHNRLHPIDAHAAAQSIVTLTEFGDIRTAARVAMWTINHMQTADGYFIYQIHRRFTNRIPYLRWANALMPYALLRLAAALRGA
ncbi:MAG: hypothetical protein JST22_09130 [Bacteroidetes bacterium]|nr:hypothetical protein [Bacteroidota bacterium]